MEQQRAIDDRRTLEALYDRPSFHCGHPNCRWTGRLQAVIEQHMHNAHPGIVAAEYGSRWFDLQCGYCGFDARGELSRLYPQGWTEE